MSYVFALGTDYYVGSIGSVGTQRYWQSDTLAVWVIGTDGNIDTPNVSNRRHCWRLGQWLPSAVLAMLAV